MILAMKIFTVCVIKYVLHFSKSSYVKAYIALSAHRAGNFLVISKGWGFCKFIIGIDTDPLSCNSTICKDGYFLQLISNVMKQLAVFIL